MSTDSSSAQPRRARTAAVVLFLILLPLLVFSGVLRHGFVDWDDQEQLDRNPDFNPPTVASVAPYWCHAHMHLYLPLTYTAWGAIARMAYHDQPNSAGMHLDARYFHAANLICHIGATLLVLAILRQLGLALMPAGLGAAVFAVHPVMVEPVAWASALYTVLSGVLSLLSIWLYLRYARYDPSKRMKWGWLALAGGAFVLAMLAKPSAVVVPVICGLLDWLLIRRPMRWVILPVIAGLLLSIPIMIIADRVQSAATVHDLPPWDRLLVAGDAIAFYFGKIVFPWRLAADYGRSPRWLLQSPQRYWTWIFPVAALAAALIAATRRRSNWPLACLGVFVAGMGVYLGLVKFEYQYYSTAADRYLYLSMLGVAMGVGCLASLRWRKVLCIIFGCLIASLSIRSAMQVRTWRDSRTLFGSTLAINPRSIVANNVIGFLDASRGNYESAIQRYQVALQTGPQNPTSHYNFGNSLLAIGDFEKAVQQYRMALSSKPDLPAAENNLGIALAKLGRRQEAAQAFENALKLDPTYTEAANNLARLRAAPDHERSRQ
jgi:Flp pilus assembly protein TadD